MPLWRVSARSPDRLRRERTIALADRPAIVARPSRRDPGDEPNVIRRQTVQLHLPSQRHARAWTFASNWKSFAVRWTCCCTWCASTRSRSSTFPIAPITDQFLEYLAVLERTGRQRGGRFPGHGQHAGRDQVADGAAPRRRSRGRTGRPAAGAGASGCWNTRSSRTRPACSTSAAAAGSSAFRAGQRSAPAASATWPRRKSTKSSCGTWSARSAASCATAQATRPSNIVYDDTPIHVYMAQIKTALADKGRVALPRAVPARHAQIGPDRHFSGHPRAGPPPPGPRRAEPAVRRDLDHCPARSKTRRSTSRRSTSTSTAPGSRPVTGRTHRCRPRSRPASTKFSGQIAKQHPVPTNIMRVLAVLGTRI